MSGAFECFSKQDYHTVKISKIARVAGVGKGTVYEYFDSKEKLYKDLLDFLFQQYLQLMEEVVDDESKNFEDKLEKLYSNHIFYYQEMQRRSKGMMLIEKMINIASQQDLENKRQQMLDLFARLIDQGLKEGVLRQDLDRQEMMMFLIVALPSLSHCVDEQGKSEEARTHSFMTLMLEGMRAR